MQPPGEAAQRFRGGGCRPASVEVRGRGWICYPGKTDRTTARVVVVMVVVVSFRDTPRLWGGAAQLVKRPATLAALDEVEPCLGVDSAIFAGVLK
jgi:hypothetical protein